MPNKPHPPHRANLAPDTPLLKWHAVSVVLRPASCNAAKAISRIRYLSGDAPRLPLANCPCPKVCGCVYKHFEDRRKAD